MDDTLSRKEAESVVTYRCAIRTELNELEAAAKISRSGKDFSAAFFPISLSFKTKPAMKAPRAKEAPNIV